MADGKGIASILVGDEVFTACADVPFVFGRVDADGVVGLDANDMGVSAVAGSVELAWDVWWVVNQSAKRPLFLEHPAGPGHVRLAPGHRHAVMTTRINVLVPGAIFTHLLEVVLPSGYGSTLAAPPARLTTGTLAGGEVALSRRERDALVALFEGYLMPFPRRFEHPCTYAEAAAVLGADWTPDGVRKATERVKTKFAKAGVYFEGARANDELAAHLVGTGVLSGDDVVSLRDRSG